MKDYTQLPRLLTAAALIGLGGAAPAADFSDPTWPCVQRKVERLSAGLMWPHPIEDVTLSDAVEADVKDLVGRMVLRRIEVEALAPQIDAFVATHGNSAALLGHVFAQAFERMARTRGKLITGIGEYSLSQIALAERIDAARAEMDAQMARETPDFDRVDALEEQIDWEERIYTDRQRSLVYVCETPVIIEKRLYALAQMLMARVDQGG